MRKPKAKYLYVQFKIVLHIEEVATATVVSQLHSKVEKQGPG